MKLFRAKQNQLKNLGARSMAPGNGQPKQLTPEQLAAQAAQARMMQVVYEAQQRQAMVNACLSGILSGVYSQTMELTPEQKHRVIDDACDFADRLHLRLVKDTREKALAQATALKAAQPANAEPPLPGEAVPDSRTAHGEGAGEAQEPPKTS